MKSRTGIRLLDSIRGFIEFSKCLPSNLIFRYKNPNYPVPPLTVMFDAYAHMNYSYYKASGEETARFYYRLFNDHWSFPEKNETRILEWGCGAARILRHLKENNPQESVHLSGTDYNPQTIRWCNNAIEGVEFQLNDLDPPLPFEDNYFDIVYCLSVFTHLSLDKTQEWLSELGRVTKPGGLISFSTQGDACRGKLNDEETTSYTQGKPIVRNSEVEGKKYFSVFHPPQYIKDKLVKGYEILKAPSAEEQEIGQDVWLIKNR